MRESTIAFQWKEVILLVSCRCYLIKGQGKKLDRSRRAGPRPFSVRYVQSLSAPFCAKDVSEEFAFHKLLFSLICSQPPGDDTTRKVKKHLDIVIFYRFAPNK